MDPKEIRTITAERRKMFEIHEFMGKHEHTYDVYTHRNAGAHLMLCTCGKLQWIRGNQKFKDVDPSWDYKVTPYEKWSDPYKIEPLMSYWARHFALVYNREP